MEEAKKLYHCKLLCSWLRGNQLVVSPMDDWLAFFQSYKSTHDYVPSDLNFSEIEEAVHQTHHGR